MLRLGCCLIGVLVCISVNLNIWFWLGVKCSVVEVLCFRVSLWIVVLLLIWLLLL